MDEFGNVSEPFISKGTVTAQVYLEECVKKRFLRFICKYHKTEDILFWPDLASAHYAKIVIAYLDAQNINFVPKKENPLNVPQARGIEIFWAECKRAYSSRLKKPKNLQGFKLICNVISKKVGRDLGKGLMDHCFKILREIGYKGLRTVMMDSTNN